MIEAEIHNKLKGLEKSEDILTSSVFGTLKWKVMKRYLFGFLGKAISYKLGKLFEKEIINNNIFEDDHVLFFWARLKNDEQWSEPDIIIEGKRFVIFIEVKHLSSESAGQLKRYYNIMESEDKYEPLNKYFIYLTADIVKPDIAGKSEELKDKSNFYWLSWYELYSVLKNQNSENNFGGEIAKDILRVLKKRRLISFDGFARDFKFIAMDETIFWKGRRELFTKKNFKLLEKPIFWRG